jgi:hypothetical protein
MKRILFVIVALLISSSAFSQATNTSKIAWDQAALTLSDSQGYTYKYYPDGSATGTAFANVVCTGATSPFQCEAPFPAFTPGNHTIQLTAGNIAGESVKTSPFAFAFVVTPASPSNVRIK